MCWCSLCVGLKYINGCQVMRSFDRRKTLFFCLGKSCKMLPLLCGLFIFLQCHLAVRCGFFRFRLCLKLQARPCAQELRTKVNYVVQESCVPGLDGAALGWPACCWEK